MTPYPEGKASFPLERKPGPAIGGLLTWPVIQPRRALSYGAFSPAIEPVDPRSPMFATVRKYRVIPAELADFDRQVNEGFLPIISAVPGFVSYQGIDAGDGDWVS